jgi:Outer membrane protein beta-barrel domain
MRYIKIIATALVLFASQTFAFSQNPANKKWDIGFKTGVEINNSPNSGVRIVNAGGTIYYEPIGGRKNTFAANFGVYATRYISNRWSLRTEFNIANNQYSFKSGNTDVRIDQSYVSLGLFPRYRINKMFDLEMGLEARKPLKYQYPGHATSTMWIGTAVHLGKVELNLRYAPGFQPNSKYSSGGVSHQIQVGMSVPLFSKKN